MNQLSVYSSTIYSFAFGILQYTLSKTAKYFEELFAQAGAKLPWVAEFLLTNSAYYWAGCLLFVLCYATHHFGIISRAAAMSASAIITLLSVIICIFGFYLPYYQLLDLVGS